jgi:molecular chaperone DnaJ
VFYGFQHNPYHILEITADATKQQIRQAYRRLAMKYHPDRNPGDPEAEGKFKQIQAAYDWLKKGKKLREMQGRTYSRESPHAKDMSRFADFFSVMMSHSRRMQKERIGKE